MNQTGEKLPVIFRVTNNWTTIEQCDLHILNQMDQSARYPTQQAEMLAKGFVPPEMQGSMWDGWVRMLKRPKTRQPYFATGLLPLMINVCKTWGYTGELWDCRHRPDFGLPELGAGSIALRDYQKDAVEAAVKDGRGVLDMPPRCHRPSDRIILSDGEIAPIGSVGVGDYLMGPDGKPKKVLEVHQGRADMYEVNPVWGEPFTVTGNHVLVIEQHNRRGSPKYRRWERVEMEVTVEEWATWAPSKQRKSYLKYASLEFGEQSELPISPYHLGVLLGDGSLIGTPAITTSVPEIREAANELAEAFGCYLTVSPPQYLVASRKDRLALLAGLLDTDGHLANGTYFEFSTASKMMGRQVAYLARGLGFQATTRLKWVKGVPYYLVNILGRIWDIPMRVPHKIPKERKLARKMGRSSFFVTPTGKGEYYGVTVEGGRYLYHDCTVMRNSGKTRTAMEILRCIALPTLWIAPTDRIVTQTKAAIEAFFGANFVHHLVGSKTVAEAARHACVVCTAATANNLTQAFYDTRKALFVDEFHHSSAKTYRQIIKKCAHIYYRFGMTGTHFRSGTDALEMHGLISNVIYKVESAELLRRGILVPTRVAFIPVPGPKLRGVPKQFNTGHGKFGLHEHEVRNQLVAQAVVTLNKQGRKILVLVGTKKQGRLIAELLGTWFKKSGTTEFAPVEFVSTDMHRKRQSKVIDAYLESDEVQVLIGTSLLGEGVDLPVTDALVYARGEKAEVSMTQNAYRVCTAMEGKPDAVIIDFHDQHHRKLREHSENRWKVYEADAPFQVEMIEDITSLEKWLSKSGTSDVIPIEAAKLTA